ncbi:hypothetical protein CA267_009720 [Alteromonas pelagimontana]|uniref:Porin n=1 Tax=Alteromonas pelagimontana TaxID=1858656 RepID=A0A6M4MCX7_9ALTE|nr:hypothetical protein [Alteromonas pelagimontana]QJR81034.1 hypothetical protein CA267_009720 [Alteromonas pelagimontana]
MKLVTFSIVLFAAFACQSSRADPFSWHGYISQGLTQSVNSNFITDNNDISTSLTELGLNGRYRFGASLSLVGQVEYLDGGNRFEQGLRLDYLFLDWRLPQIEKWQTHVHVGRFKNRHWLYSATRDVPQTRATAILPQSVYFDGFRDIALGSDGVLVQLTRATTNGNWEVNWSYGKTPLNQAQTRSFLGGTAMGEANQDFVHQFSAYWQPQSMNWRFGASWLQSAFTYHAAPVDNLVDGEVDITRAMLSMIYFSESWELSAEVIREHQQDTGGYGLNYYNERTGQGGYVQWRYLFNDKFSGLLSYDTYVLDKDDPDGTQLMLESGGAIPAYFGYEDTYAVGLRWDIAPNWRLQAEHHWVDGAGRVTGLLNPRTQATTKEDWRMWALQLMYWF